MHVWTHIVLFANFSVAYFCKNLLGNIPNPLTIFFKIGYAPAELNFTLSWKVK